MAALEARRFEAARLFARGTGQAAVMRALGVSRQTAHEWYHRWRRGGRPALKAVGRLGRKPRLDRRQLDRVETALLQGPRRHDFATDLWTLPRVATVIARLTGVHYHPGHVWYLLRGLQWSRQRPARRARERDEAAIRQWVRCRWPAVKKTPGAIVQARDRLGAPPLETLFATTVAAWATASAHEHRWRDLAVYDVDGSHLRVPDTPENDRTFGRPSSSRGRAGYPQVRIVAFLVLRSPLLAGLAVGAYDEGEVALAAALWPKLPEASLTIVDRGFLSYLLFHQIQASGPNRHWLTRAKKNLQWRVRQHLGPHDDPVDLPVHRTLRRAHPELPDTLTGRAIRYHRRGFRPQSLLTSLLDPVTYPAAEIIGLYHERWELEVAFDEVKTHTLEREETLRSRAPERIRQELWGLAIGYRHALMLIRNFWLTAWLAPLGALPRRLEGLHDEWAVLILPPRRPQRRFPRAVKIKMSNYPLKRSRRRERVI